MIMLQGLDTRVFFLINHGLSNPALDLVMPAISFLGDKITLTILLAGLCIFGAHKLRIATLIAFGAFAISLIFVGSLKTLVSRPRPAVMLNDVRQFYKNNYSNDSFPSGHSAFSFVVAWVIARRRKSAIFLAGLFAASLVGFSRIYLGLHYPSDVISGAILGIVIGEICLSVFRLPR